MKKLFSVLLGMALLQSCNNSSETDAKASPNPSNVENVNGNIPDSTNSINLNQSLPVDSSRLKDSLK
jgi:PBP1b-binding outer membrane lipoprotein LpoB